MNGATRLDPEALGVPFATVRAQLAEGTVPFAILGVANAAGTIRLETMAAPGSVPVPLDAPCLIASITKPIVATVAMRLHAEGRFLLEAPLAWWIPELATPAARALTGWHVLTHTSGMDDTWLERIMAEGIEKEDLLTRFLGAPLGAPVGSRYAYASITFDLLALAIERALGTPFTAILRETVLDPLGMTRTSWEPDPGQAVPFEVQTWLDEWTPGPRLHRATAEAQRQRLVRLRLAGAGLHSTADDLLRFGRAFLRRGELDGRRILGPTFVDLMTREVTRDGIGRADDRFLDAHYAIGWAKPGRTDPFSSTAFQHAGATGTRIVVDPAHDLVIVYLTGVWGLPWEVLDAPILGIYAALR